MSGASVRVRLSDDAVEVRFREAAGELRTVELGVVLDFNADGEVVGLEILHLKFEVGEECLRYLQEDLPTTGSGIRYSYDHECDAFYLRLSGGRSTVQRAAVGKVVVDDAGGIICLQVAGLASSD